MKTFNEKGLEKWFNYFWFFNHSLKWFLVVTPRIGSPIILNQNLKSKSRNHTSQIRSTTKSLFLLQPKEKNTWPTSKKLMATINLTPQWISGKTFPKLSWKWVVLSTWGTCKDKWHTIASDFKKIYDFMHYNKRRPCMSSDFIRFWMNSLVLVNKD